LNCLNRAMGQPDSYPFVLSAPVIDKLKAVHQAVHAKPGSASNPIGIQGGLGPVHHKVGYARTATAKGRMRALPSREVRELTYQ
jgi:hypothetical protein